MILSNIFFSQLIKLIVLKHIHFTDCILLDSAIWHMFTCCTYIPYIVLLHCLWSCLIQILIMLVSISTSISSQDYSLSFCHCTHCLFRPLILISLGHAHYLCRDFCSFCQKKKNLIYECLLSFTQVSAINKLSFA